MTHQHQFKQSGDLDPALEDPAVKAVNADRLLGRWLNTNPESRGMAGCVIEREGDNFGLSINGVGADGVIEWPRITAKVLANLEEEAGQRAVALTATVAFDFMNVETYIRVNKGVLVIVLYISFLDDSGRSNYVNREFFYRQD
jgi:hypothetical protein